jgi:hypothetical protein
MAMAARAVPQGTFDITDVATYISLGDAGEAKICTHVVQILGTWSATLIFQGTLGASGSGTYVTLGYVASTDPGTVVTAGTFTANGIYKVQADGMTDVRIKVSIAGTNTSLVVLDRPIYG